MLAGVESLDGAVVLEVVNGRAECYVKVPRDLGVALGERREFETCAFLAAVSCISASGASSETAVGGAASSTSACRIVGASVGSGDDGGGLDGCCGGGRSSGLFKWSGGCRDGWGRGRGW